MQQAVCGLIGSACSGSARTVWNALFKEQGIAAFFDFYRTGTKEDLELRLSEMFLLERRGYIVAPELQRIIVPLLDALDDAARAVGRADTVRNDGGILTGFLCEDRPDAEAARLAVWFGA